MKSWQKSMMVLVATTGLSIGCSPNFGEFQLLPDPAAQAYEEDENRFAQEMGPADDSNRDNSADTELGAAPEDEEEGDVESWDETELSEVDCSDGLMNVLLGRPASLDGVFFTDGWPSATTPANPTSLATDGDFFSVSHEWDIDTLWWSGSEPFIVFELDGSYALESLVVQADDNDSYLLSYHIPGSPADEWISLYEVPVAGGWGMQVRDEYILPDFAVADAIRLEAGLGDNLYSVGEVQAFGYALGCEPEPETLSDCGDSFNVALGKETVLAGSFFY